MKNAPVMKEMSLNTGYVIGVLATVLILVYLIYSLARPDKF